MAPRKAINPFYVLLVVVGTAFAVTACAYGVTAMRDLRPNRVLQEPAPQPGSLVVLMHKHGERLLAVELVLLTLLTVGAISTDGYWTRRAAEAKPTESAEKQNGS